ncbi:MAG: glycosyltransferase [Ornithinibacter sp.]|jgi:phosphatidyl-myo-inositol dimannoside synthase|nr:glycosyltransferase [Ornithinibacter sp.]
MSVPGEARSPGAQRHVLWGRLPDQRPLRELYWLSRMPDTTVTEVGSPRTHGPDAGIGYVDRPMRRPVKRFVEAGALGWIHRLGTVDPRPYTWVASLELCALVTGQLSAYASRHGLRQAVVTWENLPNQPLYRLPPYAWATRRALGADLMVCPIEAARDHLVALGYPESRIAVVPPGVDLEVFRPAEALGVDRDPDLVAFVSPLASNKGIDTVLDAMDVVRHEHPSARLVVAGRGPLERLVQERAAASAGAIRHIGALDRAGVARLLASAGVFTTAPRPTWKWNEQFGLAYLEAMASGIPIVTTASGTNHEAVRPPNVRTANTPAALANGLLGLLRDPAAAARIGADNRRLAEARHDLAEQTRALGAAFAVAERWPPRRRRRGGRPA